MNFHSKKTALIFINDISNEDEIELRVFSGVCWLTYEVKLAINTPMRAKPLITSTMIALSFCSVGKVEIMSNNKAPQLMSKIGLQPKIKNFCPVGNWGR